MLGSAYEYIIRSLTTLLELSDDKTTAYIRFHLNLHAWQRKTDPGLQDKTKVDGAIKKLNKAKTYLQLIGIANEGSIVLRAHYNPVAGGPFSPLVCSFSHHILHAHCGRCVSSSIDTRAQGLPTMPIMRKTGSGSRRAWNRAATAMRSPQRRRKKISIPLRPPLLRAGLPPTEVRSLSLSRPFSCSCPSCNFPFFSFLHYLLSFAALHVTYRITFAHTHADWTTEDKKLLIQLKTKTGVVSITSNHTILSTRHAFMRILRAQHLTRQELAKCFPQRTSNAVNMCWSLSKNAAKTFAEGIKHGVGGLHFSSQQQQFSFPFPAPFSPLPAPTR